MIDPFQRALGAPVKNPARGGAAPSLLAAASRTTIWLVGSLALRRFAHRRSGSRGAFAAL